MKTTAAWAFAIAAVVAACGKSDGTATKGEPKAPPPSGERIAIAVTDKGFEPENVTVPSAKPVTLVFTRTSDTTCAKEIVIPVGAQKIQKQLPLNQPVAVDVTFPVAGKITYACGMDMLKGFVVVQ